MTFQGRFVFLGFRSAKLWEVLPDARGLWDVQAYGLKCKRRLCIQYLLPQHKILEQSKTLLRSAVMTFEWFLSQNALVFFPKLEAAFGCISGVVWGVVNDHLE